MTSAVKDKPTAALVELMIYQDALCSEAPSYKAENY